MSINARFEHLDGGQRNEIFHAVHEAGRKYGGTDNTFLLLNDPGRKKVIRRMAIRFGVRENTIRDVYRHVWRKRVLAAVDGAVRRDRRFGH